MLSVPHHIDLCQGIWLVLYKNWCVEFSDLQETKKSPKLNVQATFIEAPRS